MHLHSMMAGAMIAFGSVSIVTSSLLLRRWVRPANSALPGEWRVLPEQLWVEACRTLGDVCDALHARVRLFGGARRGNAQVDTEETV
jgi:Cu+-exporting ATPase